MKRLFNITITTCFALSLASTSFSQSASVFDANYFDSKSQTPPIRPGKGFDIRDVYKQTKYCFTPEFSPEKLKPVQTGQKTSISLYYTKTDREFNELKKSGTSGKVSFLNLFHVGGNHLEQYQQSSLLTKERIVFVATVDFGLFDFGTNPSLQADAKQLIDSEDYETFIKQYGTHYISGVRKEASVWVVLTKAESEYNSAEGTSSGLAASMDVPTRGSGSLEVSDEYKLNELIKDKKYSVSVEINGPKLVKSDIEQGINQVLSDESEDKIAGIRLIINGAISNISDPEQSLITQYYYSPFTLMGVKGILWDSKKKNALIDINEQVIKAYECKGEIDKLASVGGLNYVTSEFEKTFAKVESDNKEAYKEKLKIAYLNNKNHFAGIKSKLDGIIKKLEQQYNSCLNFNCSQVSSCCKSLNQSEQLKAIIIEADEKIDALRAVFVETSEAIATPRCQKEKFSTLTIKNISYNPYNIYVNDIYYLTIPGRSEKDIYLKVQSHQLKAEQKSGYMLYPTINHRKIDVEGACLEYSTKIGFQD